MAIPAAPGIPVSPATAKQPADTHICGLFLYPFILYPSARKAGKFSLITEDVDDLRRIPVGPFGNADACPLVGGMYHLAVADIQGHMVDALSAGIKYQIARTDLCCADLTALGQPGIWRSGEAPHRLNGAVHKR